MSVIKRSIKKLLPYMPKRIAHTILFHTKHGYFLDWRNPNTYDEKITWSLANLFGEKEAVYADKLAVRNIVKNAGFGYMLPEIYGVWKDADEIDFDGLPDAFVLKTNNGSGSNCIEICHNKSTIDIEKIREKFSKALKLEIWKNQCEYHYKYIEPMVFAEELLDDHNGRRMTDYKIHCFNGQPKCIQVCSDRADSLKFDYFDLKWNHLDVVDEQYQSGKNIAKPVGLCKMVEAAERLSTGFPAARIDFYDVDGNVYFGEITLSPAGGYLYSINDKWQHIFGELMDISNCKKSYNIKNDGLD